jgi:hypothetical protein
VTLSPPVVYEGTDTELSRVYSVSSSNGGIATMPSTGRAPVSRPEHRGSSGGARTAPTSAPAPRIRLIVLVLGEPFGDHRLRD